MRAASCVFALAMVFLVCGCANSKNTIANRTPVEFRLGREEPALGFHQIYVPSLKRKLYMSPLALATEEDISDAEAVKTTRGAAVGIKLTRGGARRLARLAKANPGDWLIILVDGQVTFAPQIPRKLGRRMLLPRNLTPQAATRLADALSGRDPSTETPP